MGIVYTDICLDNKDTFHYMLNQYYRKSEDAETPQEEIDEFIYFLFDLIYQGKIKGCLVESPEKRLIGFVLWEDSQERTFGEIPGYGTILV